MLKSLLIIALLAGSMAQAQDGKKETKKSARAEALAARQERIAAAIERLTNTAANEGYTFDAISQITAHSVKIDGISYVSNDLPYDIVTKEDICNVVFAGTDMKAAKTDTKEIRELGTVVRIDEQKIQIMTEKKEGDLITNSALCISDFNLID